nr:alcohol dehydrogenase catalytic domain-containing protein [Mesorhizobium sp.]
MEFAELPEPEPAPGEVLVKVAAAGVNFMDTGVRRGLAWTDVPNPKVLGVEGAGRVISVGQGVDRLAPAIASPGSMHRGAMPSVRYFPPRRSYRYLMRSTTAPQRL